LLPLDTPVFTFLHALLAPRPDGTLPPSHAPLAAALAGTLRSARGSGFSDFILSSHLHTPRLRLVCGAPGLAVRLRFAHVPEVYDGWDGRVCFLPAAADPAAGATGSGSTASELVEAVCDELGVRRVVLQGSKSARVEYALADLPAEYVVSPMPPPPPIRADTPLPQHLLTLPGPPEEYPGMLFTVSASWLNRLGTVALGFQKHARRAPSQSPTRSAGPVEPPLTPGTPSRSAAKPGMMSLWAASIGRGAAAPALETKSSSSAASTSSASSSTGDADLDALGSDAGIAGDEDEPVGEGTLKGAPAMVPQTSDDGSRTLTSAESAAAAAAAATAAQAETRAGGATGSLSQAAGAAIMAPKPRGKGAPHTATARLSRMFEGWGAGAAGDPPVAASGAPPRTPGAPGTPGSRPPGAPATLGRSGRIVSVSGPLELEETPRSPIGLVSPTLASAAMTSPMLGTQSGEVLEGEALAKRFEVLMADLGMKGSSRTAMLALPDDRKRFLIAQNESAREVEPATPSRSASGSKPARAPTALRPADEAAGPGGIADTLSRASTALMWGNRFSIASIASWGTADTGGSGEAADEASPRTSVATSFTAPSSNGRPTTVVSTESPTMSHDSMERKAPTQAADALLRAQHTGSSGNGASLWSSWWGGGAAAGSQTAAAGSSAPSAATERDSPAYYPTALLSGKLGRKDLVKHLISLRVTLSSAKLTWIAAFLDARGLDALEALLRTETEPLLSRGKGKERERKEMSDVVLAECIKCLRTLMNTEVSSA
jgi:hypothetical protein